MKKELNVGFTACYARDYKFTHICNMPKISAILWAQSVAGDVDAGCGKSFNELTECCGQWLNKLFVIVGCDHGRWLALYNHDGKFSLRIQDE